VWERDKGVCSECGIDTADRNAVLRRSNETGIKIPKCRKSFWDAHHEIVCANGGMEYGLDVVATLCYFCHKLQTEADKVCAAQEWQETEN
jgi:5-methylcytosine-specific restriction endonuclease McrA